MTDFFYSCDKLTDALIEKKTNCYSDSKNFALASELTVEITLDEYRNLVKSVSVSEYENEKLIHRLYDAEKREEKLKIENGNLKNDLVNYISKFGKISEVESDVE